MRELFEILKKRKIRILRLEVHAKSLRGIQFYRGLGFKDHLLHLEKVIK
jgi:ribosomal protein S18 acetylase RimI-like enzyme